MMFPGRRGSIGKIRNIQGFSDHWSSMQYVWCTIGDPAVGLTLLLDKRPG